MFLTDKLEEEYSKMYSSEQAKNSHLVDTVLEDILDKTTSLNRIYFTRQEIVSFYKQAHSSWMYFCNKHTEINSNLLNERLKKCTDISKMLGKLLDK